MVPEFVVELVVALVVFGGLALQNRIASRLADLGGRPEVLDVDDAE